MSKLIDLTGEVFGRLTVIERMPAVKTTKGQRTRWLCECSCGNEIIVDAYSLRSGHTKSCGCWRSEMATEAAIKRSKTHGQSKTRLFKVWSSMKSRCYFQNSPFFAIYGGRGIVVCEEWRNSFEVFRDWALANGYDENAPFGKCTIERIDVNKNYCPENCKWVTMKEQDNNKRNTKFLTLNGRTQSAAMWADEYGIKRTTLYERLKRGWSDAEAITRPVQ